MLQQRNGDPVLDIDIQLIPPSPEVAKTQKVAQLMFENVFKKNCSTSNTSATG